MLLLLLVVVAIGVDCLPKFSSSTAFLSGGGEIVGVLCSDLVTLLSSLA